MDAEGSFNPFPCVLRKITATSHIDLAEDDPGFITGHGDDNDCQPSSDDLQSTSESETETANTGAVTDTDLEEDATAVPEPMSAVLFEAMLRSSSLKVPTPPDILHYFQSSFEEETGRNRKRKRDDISSSEQECRGEFAEPDVAGGPQTPSDPGSSSSSPGSPTSPHYPACIPRPRPPSSPNYPPPPRHDGTDDNLSLCLESADESSSTEHHAHHFPVPVPAAASGHSVLPGSSQPCRKCIVAGICSACGRELRIV